jgi:cytochrome c
MMTAWWGVAISVLALLDAAALVGQQPAPTPKPAAGETVSASQVEYDGWKVYHSYCDRCHGPDAGGSTFAPDLRKSVGANGMTDSEFTSVVRDGRTDKGMPAFQTTLTDPQFDQLYAYVTGRSTGALGPGRPKRAS